jgi:hypothetical protein
MEWIPTAEEGFDGYLKWLGKTNSTAFVALIKSLIPHQVNVRTETLKKVEYRSFEEVLVELRASGLSDEKIDLYQPSRSLTDGCPGSRGDGSDAAGFGGELVPS